MNIKRVKYKMKKEDDWSVGYIIGKYDGQLETLLDSDFKYVPKIIEDGKEYLLYDFKNDMEKQLNITLTI